MSQSAFVVVDCKDDAVTVLGQKFKKDSDFYPSVVILDCRQVTDDEMRRWIIDFVDFFAPFPYPQTPMEPLLVIVIQPDRVMTDALKRLLEATLFIDLLETKDVGVDLLGLCQKSLSEMVGEMDSSPLPGSADVAPISYKEEALLERSLSEEQRSHWRRFKGAIEKFNESDENFGS